MKEPNLSYAAELTRLKRSSRCTYWTARRTDGGVSGTVDNGSPHVSPYHLAGG